MMKRVVILLLAVFLFRSVHAQVLQDYKVMHGIQPGFSGISHSSVINAFSNKKWQLSTVSGIFSSYSFLHASNIGVVAAPVGLELTRRLNNNWYAFAALSAGPAFFSANRLFPDPRVQGVNSAGMLFNTNRFGMYSRAEAGLFYINDERTFSISGSIHVDRSSNPFIPVYNAGVK